jgi:O-succinylhomoserine sulfhydrylase
MKAHCENAQALAELLAQHPAVTATHYPGLTDDPGHDLARQQQDGFGGMLSFELADLAAASGASRASRASRSRSHSVASRASSATPPA